MAAVARRGVTAATPVTQAQIDAAEALYGRLIIWLATDEVLRLLAEEHPGWAFGDVMINADPINNYHRTRVAGVRMPTIAGQASFVPPFESLRMAATPGRMVVWWPGRRWLDPTRVVPGG